MTECVSSGCFHCGLPVTTGDMFVTEAEGNKKIFCCAGCQVVAGLIHSNGLGSFYQYRSEYSRRPERPSDFAAYDDEKVQANFVYSDPNNDLYKTAYLLLDGINCAACVWLIEKYLSRIDGVQGIKVNALSQQCHLTFDPSKISLSHVMDSLAEIGYRPQPFTQMEQQQQQGQQQRQLLLRLALAGFGMMQVSMVAIALYAGGLQGIEAQWEQLLRWVSLLVATPIVLFSAQPFWQGAWRALRQYHLSIDVPVSLAIVLAYLASAWATFTHSGDVYFDSISMFTFFLLLGRYCELRLRNRNQQLAGLASQLLPMTANKVVKNKEGESKQIAVALTEVNVGDCVRILSGETIPVDGVVCEGSSAVVEAVLTGEVNPVRKNTGDQVTAGTVNTDGSILVEVLATGDKTRLSTISQLVNKAEQDKPHIQVLADKVARYFVAAVLLVSAAVFWGWYQIDPSLAVWVTLSVLVVTCPCALSLATPTVLTAAVAAMRRQGLLVIKSHVIEALTHIDTVIFDKTGTLTQGQPHVQALHLHDHSFTHDDVIAIAAALEQGSSHPIAAAFMQAFEQQGTQKTRRVDAIEIITGAGVSGRIGKDVFHLGSAVFSLSEKDQKSVHGSHSSTTSISQSIFFSKNKQLIATIYLSDQLRDSAQPVIDRLKQQKMNVEILSGDHTVSVKPLAQQLGVAYHAEQTPEKKLQYIRRQQQKHSILMVGDGINDVPVLAGADVSVAMGNASDFTRTRADSILINNNLCAVLQAIALAKKTKVIIQQNMAWALGYNVLALPLAAMGYIPPYLAAIGMSASSLIVVLNALRVYRIKYQPIA